MKRRNFLVTAFAGLAAAIIPVFRKKPLTKELGTYVPTGPGIPVPYDKSSHLIVTTGYKKEGDGGGGIFSWSPNSFKNDRVIISGIDEGYNTVEIQVEAMPMYGKDEWIDITDNVGTIISPQKDGYGVNLSFKNGETPMFGSCIPNENKN